MKKTVTAETKLLEKSAMLDILESLFKTLSDEERDARTDFRCVGKEEEQATDWKTHELLWEDEEHTIPRYRDKYDNVELTEDELDDKRKAKISAVEVIRVALENLI